MDVERFETLAQAHGGDLRRWPEDERAAAEAFRAASPEAAAAMLRDAGDLDAALGAWRVPSPDAALRDRILASAPRARAQAAPRGFGFWLSGAGFAAVAVAGLVVGLAASNAAVSDARADALLSAALSNEGDAAASPFTVGALPARAV